MASNSISNIADTATDFVGESSKFIQKCSKPNSQEFFGMLRAVGTGFLVMGVVGFLVKLIHIPIRHFITV